MQSTSAVGERGAADRGNGHGTTPYVRRVLIAVGIALAGIVLALLVWFGASVLLLLFAAVLLAALLTGIAHHVRRWTGVGKGLALAITSFGLLAIAVAGVWLLAPAVGEQATQLAETLPAAIEQLKSSLQRSSIGSWLLDHIPNGDALVGSSSPTWQRVLGIFSSTFGVLGSLLVVVVVGVYVAVQPELYREGVVRLVPVAKRERFEAVLGEVVATLRGWLFGQAITMVVIGTLSALGLWIIGVPLALVLGILAALVNFIPNFGPFIAGAPAVLLALTISPQTALYVVLLYWGLQSLEGYLLTPMVQKEAISLPPALTILAQLLLGGLLGILGLILATPLTAAVIVMVKRLYVEDTLGDETVGEGEMDEVKEQERLEAENQEGSE